MSKSRPPIACNVLSSSATITVSPDTGRAAMRLVAIESILSGSSPAPLMPTITLRISASAIVRQLMIRLLTGKGTHVSSNCRPGLVPDGYHRVNYERNPALGNGTQAQDFRRFRRSRAAVQIGRAHV